jgi:hypothetical protein
MVFPDEICETLSIPQETIGLFILVGARATEGAPTDAYIYWTYGVEAPWH